MKMRLILIPMMLLATSVAMADDVAVSSSTSKSDDGQSQAVALLGGQPVETSGVRNTFSSDSTVSASKTVDAQAQAAALLSRPR